MPKAKQTREEIIAGLCRKFPTASTNSLADRLHREHPAIFPNINTARCAIRHRRGVRGARSRAVAHITRLPPLPESLAGAWQPFSIEARRVLVLSDLHIPFQSNHAVAAALGYGDEYKPTAVLINGDLFDFYQISRFDKNPTLASVSSELLAGGQFLDHLRKRYPKAELYFKLGNHDERWASYIFKAAPLLADVPGILDHWHKPAGIERNRVTVIGEQRPVMLGKLPILHGHELGRGISSPVNPARGAFLRAHHTILVGHSHQTSGHADTNIFHTETFCWSTGCLCCITPEYARVNRWNHGFACVTVDKDGNFDVQNLRIANGAVRTS